MITKRSGKMFWVDLEMTGLDDAVHHIIEVAVVITDTEFQSVEEFHRVVYQPKEILDLMDDWCTKTHGASGLTKEVAEGTPLDKVEAELLDLIRKHFGSHEKVVLCGNSVGNDKRFMDRYMPEVAKRLHYRIIDVSSFKEVFRKKYGIKYEKNNDRHRAVGDIYESIKEMQFYLSAVDPDTLKKMQKKKKPGTTRKEEPK